MKCSKHTWDFLEECQGFGNGHFENVGDAFAPVGDVEGFAIVAASVARFAGDVDVAQEMRVDFDEAVALAGFASSAGDVEAESAGFVATGTRGGKLRELSAAQIKSENQ